MKTPDETKKGLVVCSINAQCKECPYKDKKPGCNDKLLLDALALIQQLEAELEAVKRERDAACLKNRSIENMHLYCEKDNNCLEWCGVQENGGESNANE